jgi:aminopeptidase N
MLRMMMRDPQTGDQDFIAMMHDFVESHAHLNASTESFRGVVERHMKPALDAEGTHKIDWFFRDWVYGSDLPRYRLEYSVKPSEDGKVMLTGSLTQSGVSDGFVMKVPLYFDFDGHVVRAGAATVHGNSSAAIKVVLPKKPKRVLLNVNHDVLALESVVKEL